jgi:tetratricopeptide (TPR) repeat protein
MRTLGLLMVLTLISSAALSQSAPASQPPTLVEGIGNAHHPVSTQNADAQKFFDQGFRYIFAFNHAEAERSFQHAAELDPHLAMAYWGVAEAVGPNYNDPASADRFRQAHEAIQKAASLSGSASPVERAYIDAMAKRFPADPNSDLRAAAEQYRDAMRQVVRTYPDDLDAATLFAESGMNLHPWGLWNADGSPREGTEEVVATLESVIKRDPNHVGAVHYYIHAVEASPNPARAVAEANRLASLAPAAGHLVHMPAHIYIRTGDYDEALQTNKKAVGVDRAYLEASGAQGIYPMMYYSHNLHFIAISGGMTGDYADAKQAADQLVSNVAPHVKDVPPLEPFMAIPLAVQLRFHHWDDVLAAPQPDPSLKTVTALWHYARGMAYAGKGNVQQAQAERQTLSQELAATPADAIFAMPFNNKTRDILTIADNVLGAKIAAMLRKAVATQDALNYGEPPDWPFPVREALGGVLLMSSDNAGAEKVFREDLDRNPRNPRSLLGLREALKRQKRDYDAQFVDQQFQGAWKGGSLKVEDLV